MINFNFAATTENTQSISVRNKFGSFSARDFRTGIIVFMSVFLISFTALNFKDIFGGMKFDFWNKSGNENADNEKLTADLRALYGYTANGGEKNWLTGRMPSVAGASSAVNYGAAKNAPSSSVSGELFIPKIGVSAPIIKSSSTDAGTILNDLKSGVVLYPDSSLPGLGSSVIIGHSSSNLPWRKYGTVFAKLNNLSEGDSIYVEYEGRNLVYTVTGKKMGTAEALFNSGISGDLILGSCWPTGETKERIIITARLI